MKHFRDLPEQVIKDLISVLDEKYKPVVIVNPEQLESEARRMDLMFEAGKYAVILDLKNSLKNRTAPPNA